MNIYSLPIYLYRHICLGLCIFKISLSYLWLHPCSTSIQICNCDGYSKSNIPISGVGLRPGVQYRGEASKQTFNILIEVFLFDAALNKRGKGKCQ